MAKGKFIVLGPDHPIFNEGVTITTHRNDDGINKARRIADKVHSSQTDKKNILIWHI